MDRPADRQSPLRWEAIRQAGPAVHGLFSGSFPGGLLQEPPALRESWFHDPHLRCHAMLDLSRVVRSAEIERGDGPTFMFGGDHRTGLLDEVGFQVHEEDFPASDQTITAQEAASWTNMQGIIVVRQGKLVYEAYPGMDPSQRHHWMSISKSAIHMLLGMLVARNEIDLSRAVRHYVSELADADYGSFSIQELADMNADVDMNEDDYSDPSSPFLRWGRAIGWFVGQSAEYPGVKDCLRTIKRLPPRQGDRADRIHYTGSNSQVLGWVIENILGEHLVDCFSRYLWRPLGAIANASISVDAHGVPFVGGGWSSTLRDLARYGMIWAQRGRAPDGTQLFDERWIDESFRGRYRVFHHWRYHNHCYTRGQGMAHQGHSGQMLWVNPFSDTIVACFGSVLHPNGQERWTARLQLAMAEAIDSYLTG